MQLITGATVIGSGYFSTSTLTPAQAKVQCTGSEAPLNNCPSTPVTVCSSTNDAAIVCHHSYNPHTVNQEWLSSNKFSDSAAANCLHGELRLAGGRGRFADMEGRVEICINNAWGTVCDTRFNSEAAQVVCRQLGHPSEGWSSEGPYVLTTYTFRLTYTELVLHSTHSTSFSIFFLQKVI